MYTMTTSTDSKYVPLMKSRNITSFKLLTKQVKLYKHTTYTNSRCVKTLKSEQYVLKYIRNKYSMCVGGV